MEELWNKLGAWGYAVPILMLLCLNILLFTDIFEKIVADTKKVVRENDYPESPFTQYEDGMMYFIMLTKLQDVYKRQI